MIEPGLAALRWVVAGIADILGQALIETLDAVEHLLMLHALVERRRARVELQEKETHRSVHPDRHGLRLAAEIDRAASTVRLELEPAIGRLHLPFPFQEDTDGGIIGEEQAIVTVDARFNIDDRQRLDPGRYIGRWGTAIGQRRSLFFLTR